MESTFSTISEVERCQVSFEAALKIYKTGELDGTRTTTYICLRKIIDVADVKDMPDYIITDGPPAQLYHYQAAHGPRDEVGYSLRNYPS